MRTLAGFVTLDEAADALDCSRRRIQRLMEEGRLQRFESPVDRRRTLIATVELEPLLHPAPAASPYARRQATPAAA